jgi:hypothetical protein
MVKIIKRGIRKKRLDEITDRVEIRIVKKKIYLNLTLRNWVGLSFW